MRPRLLASLTLLPSLTVMAADWAPIPPEVWAIKEDPAKGIKDAVILEDRTVFRNTYLERIYRVRVLTETGRSAAHLNEFSKDCHGFVGRTVYPDGKVVVFDKRQDFRKEVTSVGERAEQKTMLIPPGVTGNCVMELRWKESCDQNWGSPLPERMGYSAFWRFGGAYHSLLETVEIPVTFPWPYTANSGRTLALESVEKSGFRIISGKNIPAFENPPYSLVVSQDRPMFQTWFLPDSLRNYARVGPKSFWENVGSILWKRDFEGGIDKGRIYKAFKTNLSSQIKSKSNQGIAAELMVLLDQLIVNTSQLTFSESAKLGKDFKVPKSSDLDAICETRMASGYGRLLLYFQLLNDFGIAPKLLFVADRDDRLFAPSILNPWQLSDLAVVVEEIGMPPLILDPSVRYAPAGMIFPDYQGVKGLLVDPKENWAAKDYSVPIQSADFNQKKYEFTVKLDEEEDSFVMKADFAGYPEFKERRAYMASEPAEQNRLLKERFEKALKGAAISKAEVLHASDPKQAVTWLVEGTRERNGGRQRQVSPFPGMPWPLWVPDVFPETRKLPIVMPYLQVHRSKSVIHVPKGQIARPTSSLEHANSLGKVTWAMETKTVGEASVVEVTLEITLESMFLAPDAYGQLKDYLGWISEACRRTVIIDKA